MSSCCADITQFAEMLSYIPDLAMTNPEVLHAGGSNNLNNIGHFNEDIVSSIKIFHEVWKLSF